MNYSAMIQNRKSVREFLERDVPQSAVAEIEAYYREECRRLVPEIRTELRTYGRGVRAALEGSAGYENFLIGASEYLVLLSEEKAHAGENAGYIMEDLVLKLTEMGFDSCWITRRKMTTPYRRSTSITWSRRSPSWPLPPRAMLRLFCRRRAVPAATLKIRCCVE